MSGSEIRDLSGTIEIDGHTVKWDRLSNTGLAIEFDCTERLHIGGEPTEERIRVAVEAYRIGMRVGISIGKAQKQNEIQKALGI